MAEEQNEKEIGSDVQVHTVNSAERIRLFIDHGSVQTLVGLVGGLVGTFLDGRYFTVLCLFVPYGLLRSKALDGLHRPAKTLIYVASILIAGRCLFEVGRQLNRSRPQTYTPSDYAKALKAGTTLPIIQQITNVYNPPFVHEKVLRSPQVDLGEWIVDSVNPDTIVFHTEAINSGDLPALDVRGTTQSFILPESIVSEKYVFNSLEKHAFDADAPTATLPVGIRYIKNEPLVASRGTIQEKSDPQFFAHVMYLGRVDSYKDESGNRYLSELCMFLRHGENRLLYCKGHNSTIKLSK